MGPTCHRDKHQITTFFILFASLPLNSHQHHSTWPKPNFSSVGLQQEMDGRESTKIGPTWGPAGHIFRPAGLPLLHYKMGCKPHVILIPTHSEFLVMREISVSSSRNRRRKEIKREEVAMLRRVLRSRSRSQASSEQAMSTDTRATPSPAASPSPMTSPFPDSVLTLDVHLQLHGGEERSRYAKLKDRNFVLTPMLDDNFLEHIGILPEFRLIFSILGWTSFYVTTEKGCRLLTLEFLCTLKTTDNGVTFRLFRRPYAMSWRQLSMALGFEPSSSIDMDSALSDFNKGAFWQDITGKGTTHKARTNDIHLPTLKFLHRWMTLALFP